MMSETDKLKKVIDDIDNKFLSEVIDDSVKYTDKDKISRYEDKEDGSYYDLYYIKDKDIKDGENLFEDKKIRDWTKTLQNIFEKYTGKPMSVNALRKSYATHFIGPSKVSQADVDDIAEQMGTSADLLRTVYYKVG